MVFTTTVGFSVAIDQTDSAGLGNEIVRFCPSQRCGYCGEPVAVTSEEHHIGVAADQFRSDCADHLPVAPSTQIVCIHLRYSVIRHIVNAIVLVIT